MEDGYIKKQDALDALYRAQRDTTWSMDHIDTMDQMIDYVEKLPVEDIEPPRYGKWIPASTKPGVHAGMKCSECKARITYSEHFNGQHDTASWQEWFSNKYCNNCESIKCKYEDTEKTLGFTPYTFGHYRGDVECAYCEIYKKCKFFEDLEDTPSSLEIIKMWLNADLEKEEAEAYNIGDEDV